MSITEQAGVSNHIDNNHDYYNTKPCFCASKVVIVHSFSSILA